MEEGGDDVYDDFWFLINFLVNELFFLYVPYSISMLNKMFAKLCASNATCLCVFLRIQLFSLNYSIISSKILGGTSFMDGLNLDRLKTFIRTFSQKIVMTIYIFEISLFSAVIAKC